MNKPYFIIDEKGNQIGMTEKEFIRYCKGNKLIEESEELLGNKYSKYMTNSEKELFLSLS